MAAVGELVVGGLLTVIGGPIAKSIARITIKKLAPAIVTQTRQVVPNIGKDSLNKVVVANKRAYKNTVGYSATLTDFARAGVGGPTNNTPAGNAYLLSVNRLVTNLIGSPFAR
jgi:hypothetical protein